MQYLHFLPLQLKHKLKQSNKIINDQHQLAYFHQSLGIFVSPLVSMQIVWKK